MIELRLTEAETAELKQVLDERLNRLFDELVHTDDRDYHAALRARCDRLEALQRRLGSFLAPQQPRI